MEKTKEKASKMTALKERARSFFLKQPLPLAAVQLSAGYVTGIKAVSKNGRIKSHFILPLEKDAVKPSFLEKNIIDARLLERTVLEGIRKLDPADNKIAFILPELSQRTFVFFFDVLPSSQNEREKLLLFRIKKQMPLLPDDVRLSFDVIRSNDENKVIATIVRAGVIREYEDLFQKIKLRVRVAGVPLLSLLPVLRNEQEKNGLLVNIEEDSLNLAAVIDSELALFRQKPFASRFQVPEDFLNAVDQIVQEIKNTVNFIADRDKAMISSTWIRLGLFDHGEEGMELLDEKLDIPVKRIESLLEYDLTPAEGRILSPLIGQIL
jgi:hypothetical protein